MTLLSNILLSSFHFYKVRKKKSKHHGYLPSEINDSPSFRNLDMNLDYNVLPFVSNYPKASPSLVSGSVNGNVDSAFCLQFRLYGIYQRSFKGGEEEGHRESLNPRSTHFVQASESTLRGRGMI